jgi:hypothetical protein
MDMLENASTAEKSSAGEMGKVDLPAPGSIESENKAAAGTIKIILPLCRWRNALVWVHRRMTPPRGSSSESDSAGDAADGQREDPHKPFATPHSKAEARDHHAQTKKLRSSHLARSARDDQDQHRRLTLL